jgi:hypothetical protein
MQLLPPRFQHERRVYHRARAMPTIAFTSNMQRHVECPTMRVEGATLGAALEAYFAAHPRVKAYVLDEQGVVRHHVAIFVDGEMLANRRSLDVAIAPTSEIFVMQALSGG